MKITERRISKSKQEGYEAERRFMKLAVENNYEVINSSQYSNIIEHWDKRIRKNGISLRVDVKAIKCLYVGVKQDNLIWIEIKGITGHSGWLYGRADLFAFETFNSFVLIKKEQLIAIVNCKVDFDKYVIEKRKAIYCIYQREGRKDIMTLIPTEEIRKYKWAEWYKENNIKLNHESKQLTLW